MAMYLDGEKVGVVNNVSVDFTPVLTEIKAKNTEQDTKLADHETRIKTIEDGAGSGSSGGMTLKTKTFTGPEEIPAFIYRIGIQTVKCVRRHGSNTKSSQNFIYYDPGTNSYATYQQSVTFDPIMYPTYSSSNQTKFVSFSPYGCIHSTMTSNSGYISESGSVTTFYKPNDIYIPAICRVNASSASGTIGFDVYYFE